MEVLREADALFRAFKDGPGKVMERSKVKWECLVLFVCLFVFVAGLPYSEAPSGAEGGGDLWWWGGGGGQGGGLDVSVIMTGIFNHGDGWQSR